ncbi:hypothetical protein, partial [Janibacter anophelis]|uniref:hypothetical protein n=1 Tax=Janibacter anophelis TaxID=319054 RepID=UPI00196391D9
HSGPSYTTLLDSTNDGRSSDRSALYLDARRVQEVRCGKDLSRYGFEYYTRVKHVMANIDS